MFTPSRPSNSLSAWSIHDKVRTTNDKDEGMPLVKPINFKDSDTGMTITLTARDLGQANYPEFVAQAQDVSQACWTVAGKNFKPAFELLENRVLEVIRTFCLGHTLTVVQEVFTNPIWLQSSHAARKKDARQNGTFEEFKNKCKEDPKDL